MTTPTERYTVYPITPVGKPRMTRRDRWKKRPCVERYFAFRDLVALHGVHLPEYGAKIVFGLPMPASWPKKKRLSLASQPHLQKPDVDNLLKGLMDAVYPDEDSRVWDIAGLRKVWATDGFIRIEFSRQEVA